MLLDQRGCSSSLSCSLLHRYHLWDVTLHQRLNPPPVSQCCYTSQDLLFPVMGKMLFCLRAVGRLASAEQIFHPARLFNVLQNAAAPDASVRFMIRPTVREQSQPVSLHTAARISLHLPPSKDGAIHHRGGQLCTFFSLSLSPSRYLSRSAPPPPNSAFLWKTAVILIDEIQRCPKQSPRSPTVAHRQGCCSVAIVPREERSASGEHHAGGEKNPDFQLKRGRKAFLYRQWESGGEAFPLAHGNNTCLAFFSLSLPSFRCIETRINRAE